MKRKFLVPVVSAISALFCHQVQAALSTPSLPNEGSTHNIKGTSANSNQVPGEKALSEFSVFDKGDEYLFLMQRSEAGVLTAYHSSHRSHSSHSSHRSHYSSR